MDPKIAKVLSKMVSAPDGIADVMGTEGEYFFSYKGHVFSLLRAENRDQSFGSYSFYVYPGTKVTEMGDLMARNTVGHLEDIEMIAFHSGETNLSAERKLFADLYVTLKRRNSNLDSILDDILK